MINKLIRKFVVGFQIMLFAASLHAAEAGVEEYKKGTEAFRSGDYQQALRHFESARGRGYESPTLIYNLGVTHYKLRQYARAERLFLQLENDHPRWRDISRYNLGLIALRRQNSAEAGKWFRTVRRTSSNEKLVYLAGEGLRELNLPVEPDERRPAKKWFTLLSLGGGYDDNAIAFPDRLQTNASQGEDYFLEALAYGQVYVSGNRGDGIRLHGFAFTKQYEDLDIVDVNTFSGGVTRDSTYNDWDIEYGIGVGYSEVDSDELTTQLQGKFKLGRTLGRNEYTAAYRPVYHDAGSAFPQLDGWQHRLDLRWRHRAAPWRWTIRYRLEYNDRDDLTGANSFLSYSPLRNSIRVEGDWNAIQDWTFTAGAEYTNSHYSDANRLTDIDGVFKDKKRNADTVEAWAKVQYELTRDWRVLAEYRYRDNNENFLLYDYDRNEIKIAIEFTY